MRPRPRLLDYVLGGLGLYVLIGLIIGVMLFAIPLPVLVFGPGAAVDLNNLVVVPDHTPPSGKLYLTDVTVMPGRPATYLAGKLLPGFEVVPRRQYAGNSDDSQFDRQLEDAMTESQTVAQIVAERAAGLHVTVKQITTVAGINRSLPAAHCFKLGDVVDAIEGHVPTTATTVPEITASKPAGTLFHLAVERGGTHIDVACRTASYKGRPRFGIIISTFDKPVDLPVHVTYHVAHINGSSAGLMFALQIYRSLMGEALAGGKNIAGTGVLSPDGTVLPVGGAIEKLQAAIRKHADVFLVPKTDFPSIEGTPGITIVAVSSFADAIKKLSDL